MEEKKIMNDEKFRELMRSDKWIGLVSDPIYCCDKYSRFLEYRTCSYPVEYVVNEVQIAEAKRIKEIRRKEILEGIKPGELVFSAMGMDYKSEEPDEVCNHRIRCEFLNSKGKHYFAEFFKGVRPNTFYCDFLIDRDLEEKRNLEMRDAFEMMEKHPELQIHPTDKQDYYLHKFMKRIYEKPFTWANILDFINKNFKCSYKSARMINYLVSYNEWICKC